jgi:Uncharacterized conserved protein, contains double-stranded beta-helix domain
MTVAHWDEVDWRHNAKGEMDATWQRLGDSAGARGVGVNRVRVEPGKLPTPPHSHGASEELYFVWRARASPGRTARYTRCARSTA